MLKRYISIVLLLSLFIPFGVQAADSCTSPTATLTVNSTKSGQEIVQPYTDGSTTNGESLYYQINITDDGVLDLKTAIDSLNSGDTVNTFGYFLDENCNQIVEATATTTNPRLVSTSINVYAGKTYFFKVENHENTADIMDGFEYGFFQVENTFTRTISAHEITVEKSSPSSVNSGAMLTYQIKVTNTGNEDTKTVHIVDTMPADFIYIDSRDDSDWSCTQSGQTITCDLDSSKTISALGGTKSLYLDVKAKFLSANTPTTNSVTVDVSYVSAGTLSVNASKTVMIYKATPSITITKKAVKSGTTVGLTNGEIIVGESFDYLISVSNSNANALMVDSNVIVTDDVPSEFTVLDVVSEVAGEWDCTKTQSFECKLNSVLAANGVAKVIRVKVQAGATEGPFSNIADVKADTPLGSVTASATDTSIVKIVQKDYDILFEKSNPDITVPLGADTTYTLKARNLSNVALTNVHVTDTMPSQLVLNNISSAGWDCTSSTSSKVDCIADLSLGETKYINITAKANEVKDAVTNTANVQAENIDKNATNILDIVSDAAIMIDKKAVETDSTNEISGILKDSTFEYLLAVTNESTTLESTNVIIGDNVPAGITVISVNPETPADWNCVGLQNFTCTLTNPLVASASTTKIRVEVKATGASSGTPYTNIATVDADTIAGTVTDTDDASVTIFDGSYDADFTKINPDSSVIIGSDTTYSFFVTNRSNVALKNINVIDIMPSDYLTVLDPIVQAGWTCKAVINNTVDCTYASDLDVNATTILQVKAKAIKIKDDVVNTATLTADLMATKDANETIDIVNYPSDIKITKDASQQTILENDTFVYTIKVENLGDANETNLVVTDIIPVDFNITSISSGSWSCPKVGQEVTCTLALLEAHSKADDINITVEEITAITGNRDVTNHVNVKSDEDTAGKFTSKTVQFMANSDALTLTKHASAMEVYIDAPFNYTLEVINSSGKEIDNPQITDTFPSNLQYVSDANPNGWTCNYDSNTSQLNCDKNGTKLAIGSEIITINVLAPSTDGNITNSATLTSDLDSEKRESNVTTVVNAKVALLEFTEQSSSKGTVITDEAFTYEIIVKNSGVNVENDVNATNVIVTVDLFPTLYDLDINASGWDCNQSGTTLSCLLQTSLAPSVESPPIYIEVKSNAEATTMTGFILTSDQSEQKDTSILVEVNNMVNANLALQISDSVDIVEAGRDFSYNIIVNNEGTSAVKDVIVNLETTSMANFTLDSVNAAGWNCTQSLKQVNCNIAILVGGASSTITLNVTAPDLNTTLEVNATVRSDYVNDSDLSDNHASESTDVLILDFNVDNLRDFTQVLINGQQNTNIYGEVFTIGNQSLCEQSAVNVCQEPSRDVNDWVYQENANLDPSSPHASSTSATLNLTAGDEVIWAGLYWMGMIDRNNGADADMIDEAQYVYLRHDSEVAYTKLESAISKFNWKNDVAFGSNHFDYQGVTDVTEYVKIHKDGDYWVAGIQTTEGTNISAGWSLVVVVEDNTQTRKLKNITLFDGYQAVWKNTSYTEANQYPDAVKASVNGFLTPNNGAVNSKLTLFALEGDKTLDDSILITDENNVTHNLSNGLNPADDVVNGTISDSGVVNHNRFPDLANTSGIDIDTFDVSSIVGNGQSATDITISSEGDRFFLGMFTFSTELYLPQMCYIETMTKEDYSPLTNNRAFYLGDSLGFEVSVQNDEDETARNISLKTKVDVIYRETNSTLQIKNISEGSFSDHTDLWDTYEINATNDQNETVPQTVFDARIGAGANSTSGGDMSNGESISFHFNGIIDGMPDANETKNIYYISYEIDNMGSVVDTAISPCYDLNQSIYISQAQPQGFSVTHKGGSGDSSGNGNHLYTQLTDESFKVDIVSLKTDLSTGRPHRGIVRLDLVDVDVSITADMNETVKENICKSFATLTSTYVRFNDVSRKTQELIYHDSARNLGFRVHYPLDAYGDYAKWIGVDPDSLTDFNAMLDESGVTECKTDCASDLVDCRNCIYDINNVNMKVSCASDSFAIRPHTIMIDANETTLVGGRDYNLSMEANATGYNQNFPANEIKYSLSKPAGCTLADDNGTINHPAFAFVDGNASITTFTYENVGDINVTLKDYKWTLVDQNASDDTMSDCIVGSSSNTRVGDKYGCDIDGSKDFSFSPKIFKSKVNLQNDNNGTFTYFDDGGNRSAKAYITITAYLDDNVTVATNYTAGCFAKDINYTISPSIAFPLEYNLSTYSDANTLLLNPINPNEFNTSEGNFSSGIASPILGINFARSKTKPLNPFDLNSSDLNISVSDENNVRGKGFSQADNGARYYYARLYSPDYLSIEPSNFKAGLFYEVYCDEGAGCDKTVFNLSSLSESVDHVNWYIFNSNHSGTFGDYDAVGATAGLNATASSVFALDLNLSATAKRPFCGSVSLTPDGWFMYDEHSATQANRLSFKACFTSVGSWAGKGDIGLSVDRNISKDKNTKIDW